MTSFHFTITTPDRALFDGDVEAVTLPSAEGEITVLAHHEPLVCIIIPGELKIRLRNEDRIFAVSRGFLEVRENRAALLATTAEHLEEIDEARAEEAKRKAEEAMSQKLSAEEYAETAALLERNLARLQLVRKHRTRHMPHVE